MIILMAHERNITPLGFFFLLFIIIFYFNVIMDKVVDTLQWFKIGVTFSNQILPQQIHQANTAGHPGWENPTKEVSTSLHTHRQLF